MYPRAPMGKFTYNFLGNPSPRRPGNLLLKFFSLFTKNSTRSSCQVFFFCGSFFFFFHGPRRIDIVDARAYDCITRGFPVSRVHAHGSSSAKTYVNACTRSIIIACVHNIDGRQNTCGTMSSNVSDRCPLRRHT